MNIKQWIHLWRNDPQRLQAAMAIAETEKATKAFWGEPTAPIVSDEAARVLFAKACEEMDRYLGEH